MTDVEADTGRVLKWPVRVKAAHLAELLAGRLHDSPHEAALPWPSLGGAGQIAGLAILWEVAQGSPSKWGS